MEGVLVLPNLLPLTSRQWRWNLAACLRTRRNVRFGMMAATEDARGYAMISVRG